MADNVDFSNPLTWAGTAFGLFSQSSASNAAEESAAAQLEAAKIAADAAKFRPYGVTTGFGTSWFNPQTQQAGYQLDPALAAYRDSLLRGAAQVTDQYEFDPTKAAQRYYDETQAMMAPTRAQEQKQLQQNLFGSGRLGLRLSGEGAGAGTGGMYQPDVLGYNKAQELANQNLAMQSRQNALNELDASIARGTGLFTSATGVEALGQNPLDIGSALGAKTATAGANVGANLLKGGLAAAESNLASGVGWANTLGDIGSNMIRYNKV
jgi:hypothetical protein